MCNAMLRKAYVFKPTGFNIFAFSYIEHNSIFPGVVTIFVAWLPSMLRQLLQVFSFITYLRRFRHYFDFYILPGVVAIFVVQLPNIMRQFLPDFSFVKKEGAFCC